MDKELWLDIRKLDKKQISDVLPVAFNHGYEAIMINTSQADLVEKWPKNCKVLVYSDTGEEKPKIQEIISSLGRNRKVVLFSSNLELLKGKWSVCDLGVFTTVKDKESMNLSIELSRQYKDVIIHFESDTNIPLELILAFSQKNKSRICKIITTAEDGWIATMTMEMGSYSVLLSTGDIQEVINMRNKVSSLTNTNVAIQELTVQEVKHIGMGDRVCIDTTSRLEMDEGMIIGSTSTGGILVSSETHYLPYMDLRPFRVNAGAIHSYIWCADNTTKYFSELKAGDEVMTVRSDGSSRIAAVGRIKMERRPMLLIRAISESGEEVNTIVQDDWHIRIITKGGDVINSTLLNAGDTVLGYTTKPGRHLGVEIEESIIER